MVWTKHPKRLNSLVCATTMREESSSVTTDVALKGTRATLRRSVWRSARICCIFSASNCFWSKQFWHSYAVVNHRSHLYYLKRYLNGGSNCGGPEGCRSVVRAPPWFAL